MENSESSLYFLHSNTEMGKLIREKDWSKTTLGDPKYWPKTLATMVSVMLENPFGMYIAWGKDFIQLYNDGYRPILGENKHPCALGISTKETFGEIWHIIGPMFENVIKGVPISSSDFMLPLNRNGFIEECYFVYSYSPIRLENGDVGGVLVTVIETTEKKKIEDDLKKMVEDEMKSRLRLEESEERFRSVSDQSPMIVYIVEPNDAGTVSFWSKTWLNYTGQTFDEAIGRAWNGIVHPDDIQAVFDIYIPAFENKQPYTIPKVRLKRYDGEYRWHLFKANPRKLNTGEFMGYVGVGFDIHEQQILFEQLAGKNFELTRSNNDLDNFIYTASHDLKAPMLNIEGLINTLRDSLTRKLDMVLDDDSTHLIELIETSINRFKNTIEDLTEISRVQNSLSLDVEDIDIEMIVNDVNLSIHSYIINSKAEIVTDFTSTKYISFSRKNLKSIVYNLIANAIKYKDKNRAPQIKIKTEIKENYTILIVSDNGLGLSVENQGKMFTMFKRFHDHVEGTGVGLYIVKRILDNAGAKIEIESEVGKGTIFKIFFKNGD